MRNSLVREQIRQQGMQDDQRAEREKEATSQVEPVSSRRGLNQTTAVSPGASRATEEEKARMEEQIMLDEEALAALKKIKKAKFMDGLRKICQIVLGVGCAYLVFLIYGVLNTNFTYDYKGNVVPMVVSVENIRETNDFTTVKTQYLQARTLYEQVLTYDYRLALGYEDPLLIAPEYEKTLESISSLSVQVGAITPPAKYTQLMNMLLSWVQNDIALYCQYMSRAITQNNVSDANKATSYKDIMYNDFMQITQVISTTGASVENADVSDIISWTPEKYISQFMTGGN